MTLSVTVSDSGGSAVVSGKYHAHQLLGLADADHWIAFYEREVGRRNGRFYTAKLAAFREARATMAKRMGVE